MSGQPRLERDRVARHIKMHENATRDGSGAVVLFETLTHYDDTELKALEAQHLTVRMRPEPAPYEHKNAEDFYDPPIVVEKWRWIPPCLHDSLDCLGLQEGIEE
ncbi:unnamed protein product, partial [Mesorhabditis spiculigera]